MEKEIFCEYRHGGQYLRSYFFYLVAAFLFLPAFAFGQSKYWIEFTDKGLSSSNFKPGNPIFDNTLKSFSNRALLRRSIALATQDPALLISIEDAPLAKKYLDSLRAIDVFPITLSNWANAISSYLSPRQVENIRSLKFIRRISLLPSASSNTQTNVETESMFFPEKFATADEPDVLPIPAGYDSIIYHYGNTGPQLTHINVPPLHAMGFDGSGVLLGYLDVGFRWRAMRATSMHHVLAEYDFIYHDSMTYNDHNDPPSQDGHGSLVLSAATGYLLDSIIGPAYRPDLLLAKTEDLRSETPIEEDNYTAALEWMEKLGVDITSSSLGYFSFDSGFTSYTYPDMNGRTTISAKACARAARLGVLCCTAMGNGGSKAYPYLITPSDADSIISVGAVALNDTIADFSSRGPTFDQRLKPETCAPGVHIWCTTPDDILTQADGTSLATPLVSGACALIKQAHPEASAQAIRRAIIKTGQLLPGSTPDTAYGFGRLNAYNAALSLGTIIGTLRMWRVDSVHSLEVGIAANNQVRNPRIVYAYNVGGIFTNSIPLTLAADSLIYTATFPLLPKGTHIHFYIETHDGADTVTLFPRTAPDSVISFYVGDSVVTPPFAVRTKQPNQEITVTPNPAHDHISISTGSADAMKYEIVDALGRVVLRYDSPRDTKELRIRLEKIPAGLYHIHARSASAKIEANIKLIIQ
ncbi:MAG: S8 family serine peptidase [Ignavibacteriota bacterium]